MTEVIRTLERSLVSVDQVFADPAREAMLREESPGPMASQIVREHADKLAPVADKLLAEFEPQLLTQDAILGQILRELCDVAPDACRCQLPCLSYGRGMARASEILQGQGSKVRPGLPRGWRRHSRQVVLGGWRLI